MAVPFFDVWDWIGSTQTSPPVVPPPPPEPGDLLPPLYLTRIKKRIRLALGIREDLVRTSPTPENGSANETTLVTLFLSGVLPAKDIVQGTGRYQVIYRRTLFVTIRTRSAVSAGNSRDRDLALHWDKEQRIISALQQMTHSPDMVSPPLLEGGTEDYSTIKEVQGGLESQLRFRITYKDQFTPLDPVIDE